MSDENLGAAMRLPARLSLTVDEVDALLFPAALSTAARRRLQRRRLYPPSVKIGDFECVLARRLNEFIDAREKEDAERRARLSQRGRDAINKRWAKQRGRMSQAGGLMQPAPEMSATSAP